MYDRCYGTDFENRIADYLRFRGFTVFQSVYAEYNGKRCQNDLVVFDGLFSYTLECKAYDANQVSYARSSNMWHYSGINGKLYTVPNPIIQSRHHSEVLSSRMIADLEGMIYDKAGLTLPQVGYGVVLKGNIRDYPKEHVYTENDKSLDRLVCWLRGYAGKVKVESWVSNMIYEWLKSHSDQSLDRLKKHANYVKECKRNKTGFFEAVEVN